MNSKRKQQREHLANFHIAGFNYYDGALCFSKLKVGTKLELEYEVDNKYDARAVAIYYKGNKLGFIPRTENRIFYKLVKMGYENALDVRIQQIDATAHPEQQISVVVHLLPQE
ncbi:HIRAN domain-containing protein [Riemerella anatipestifer]|nr:HIRAN domain-containing protein [Riemerella anatipestifer]MDY3383901.1 HIRAN domain-containing protein [Riemerella anatipestifer]MDY3479511.1 HIRAN domain-containing protein [Riemerella anatipestifer]